MSGKTKPRTIVHKGRTIELLGPSTKVAVWIDGERHVSSTYFWRSLTAARFSAISYCDRHARDPVVEYVFGLA